MLTAYVSQIFRDCPQYAPVASHSVRFCFANSETDTSPSSQLTLFDAAHGKCNVSKDLIFTSFILQAIDSFTFSSTKSKTHEMLLLYSAKF